MATAIEKLGQILIQRGVLTRAQFDACALEYARQVQAGASLRLSEVIVSRGFAQPGPISESLRAAGALPFTCLTCGKPSTLELTRLDAVPTCPHCKGSVEFEESAPVVSRGSSAPATAPQVPVEVTDAAKDPKRKLGKYTLLAELGRGGYAVVYKAWDDSLRQYVALKLLRTQDIGLPDGSQDSDLQEFFREARTAVKLSHPNIVRIFELGSHQDRHFLSMELIDGSSLAEKLRQERTPARPVPFFGNPTKYLRILRDVALALDYAHRQTPPIIHRDVKPQNILVDKSGRACVVDFGLAKELRPEGGHTLTLSGTTKGTPCYMSPEQATGKGPPMDARTDVYSLGAVLYELLTGEPPFNAPTSREILNKVVNEDPQRPSDLLKARSSPHPVPADLERICLRALEKDRTKRYPSARAFAADLDRFLSGKDVQARDVPAYERMLRWARPRMAVVISAGLALLMGIIALVAVLRSGRQERVVERVFVKDEAETQYRQAVNDIDARVASMNFDGAARICETALGALSEGSQKEALRRRLDELLLQASLLQGLQQRIQKNNGPRDYDKFYLRKGPALETVGVYDATPELLYLHRGEKTVAVEWSSVAPRQFVDLARDYWPDMDGRASLALGVWCLRNDLTNDAAVFFNRPDSGATDAQTRRYRAELSAKAKTGNTEPDPQVARLLEQAEKALASGDAIVARARYERVLAIKPDDRDAADGLKRVAVLEAKPKTEPDNSPKLGVAPSADATARMAAAAVLRDPDVAMTEYLDLLRTEPNVAELHYRVGYLHHRRGGIEESLPSFNRALELDPWHKNAHIWRGLAFFNLGRWKEAAADLREGLRLQSGPDYGLTFDLWVARAHGGEVAEASQELRTLMSRWSPAKDAEWYRTCGDYLVGDRTEADVLKAADVESTSLPTAKKNSVAQYLIGQRRLASGDKAGGAAALQKCIDIMPAGMILDLFARLELDRINGTPLASAKKARTPVARPATPRSEWSLPSILSLMQNVGQVSVYAQARTTFVDALRDRDPAKAAAILADFEKNLGATPEAEALRSAAPKALAKIAAGSLSDPTVVALLRAAEDWLAATEESAEIIRGLAFDLRDVALLALAYADWDEALGRNLVVTLQSGKKGGFRKTPKGLVQYELMDAGGQKAEVGSAASLRGDTGPRIPVRDLVSVLRADRARRNGDDARSKLTDFLLLAYDAKTEASADAPETKEVRTLLSAADWKRLRMDEYLSASLRGTTAVDLLSAAHQPRWRKPAGALFDTDRITLSGGNDILLFPNYALMSGSRVDVEFRVNSTEPKPRLELGTMNGDADLWMTTVELSTKGGLGWLSNGRTTRTETPALDPAIPHRLSVYLSSPVIVISVDGRVQGRTWAIEKPGAPRAEGLLALRAREGAFRITRIRVSDGRGGGLGDLGGAIVDTNFFHGRWKDKGAALNRYGGTTGTETAVRDGLLWLARHQNPDGSWSAESFQGLCADQGRCGGPGARYADRGVTGLALLAFQGAGFTHLSRDEFVDPVRATKVRFGDVVRNGLLCLLAQQDPEGCFGDRDSKYMYGHAISTEALAEAYGMTSSPLLKSPAQKAVDFLVAAQNPGKGWRYSAKCGDNDTSVTGWATMALKTAEFAPLSFPKSSYDGALNWIREATENNGYFQVGYNAVSTGKVYVPGKNEQFDHHATMSAIGMVGRLAIWQSKTEPALGAWNLLVSDVPEWKTNKTDFYYWYWGSAALLLWGGDTASWGTWNIAMKKALMPNQHPAKNGGCRQGSWDPDNERWGSEGGRIYTTAMAVLTLETYYRLPFAPAALPKK